MLLFYLAAIDGADGKLTFEYYYVTYRRQMFAAAYSVLRSTQDAEDAVHNAFLGIAKHVDVLLGANEHDAKCYCLKAAKNAALNILRKNSAQEEEISFIEITDDASFDELTAKAEYEELLDAIKSMDSVYRDVLYMRYVMDMSVKQIADVLGRKNSAVKQQLVRGKKLLVNKLSEEVTGHGK